MAKKTKKTTDELLKDLIIIQLGLAGVPQQQIRKIVGGDLRRVTSIVRHLKINK